MKVSINKYFSFVKIVFLASVLCFAIFVQILQFYVDIYFCRNSIMSDINLNSQKLAGDKIPSRTDVQEIKRLLEKHATYFYKDMIYDASNLGRYHVCVYIKEHRSPVANNLLESLRIDVGQQEYVTVFVSFESPNKAYILYKRTPEDFPLIPHCYPSSFLIICHSGKIIKKNYGMRLEDYLQIDTRK